MNKIRIGIVGYGNVGRGVEMSIAPRDFWRFSSWQVFKKKMGYAFGVYLVVTLVAAGVLASIFG